jgi:hypothetical protein
MNNLLKYAVPALVLGISATAHAGDWHRHNPPPPPPPAPCQPGGDHVAPEVDPSLAIGAFTLLGGTLTVLRSRRSR